MKVVAIVASVVLGLGGAVFGIVIALRTTSSRVTGTISGSGGDLGTFTMQPDRCVSGERNQFRGVQLFSGDGDAHGTAYADPIGGSPTIAINLEHAHKARKFEIYDCKVLDGEIERQNSTVNRITNIKGHIRFDCTTAGEHATGDVTFENCH